MIKKHVKITHLEETNQGIYHRDSVALCTIHTAPRQHREKRALAFGPSHGTASAGPALAQVRGGLPPCADGYFRSHGVCANGSGALVGLT